MAELHGATGKYTKEALENKEALQILSDEVISHFRQFRQRVEDGREQDEWLTPFGDHLLGVLRDGAAQTLFSDALPVYLKHTGRDHLAESNKAVHDTKRYLAQFVSVAGDKPLDQISRKDVERYVKRRLEEVKTTSVEREVSSLRAIWSKVAKAADVRSQ